MLRGFATVNYWADDLEAAKEWCSELLGIEPYFERPGYYGFRVGDYQHELGVIDLDGSEPDAWRYLVEAETNNSADVADHP
jgi:hypothetical protein